MKLAFVNLKSALYSLIITIVSRSRSDNKELEKLFHNGSGTLVVPIFTVAGVYTTDKFGRLEPSSATARPGT